ncbi:MAG: HEAT repeat domain-containing protein [Phycisphaerae bacterium]
MGQAHRPEQLSGAPQRLRRRVVGCVLAAAGWCLAFSSACDPGPFFRARIQSENPGDRILAVYDAAQAKDDGAVPLIVDRLEDEDDGVRFFAIQALERLTGKRFGYDYAQSAPERAAAVERWRDYLRNGRKQSEAKGPPRLGPGERETALR